MNNNIKNIVAIGIAASIINSGIIPVFATEKIDSLKNDKTYIDEENSVYVKDEQDIGDKEVLKLDNAIEAAVNHSDKFALKSKEIKMYKDKMNLQEKTNDLYEAMNQEVYDFPYDKLELQKNQTKQSKDFMKDQIESDITNKYNDMILKEIEIDKLKRNIELKKNDLYYLEGNLSLGMATDNAVNDAQIELKSLQDDLTVEENSLNNSKDYFKVLTDLDLKNTYILDYDINYTKFKIDSSIDEYIDEKLDEYFKYNDKLMDLTNDYLDELKDDDIEDIMDEDVPEAPNKSKYVIADKDGNMTFDSGTYALNLLNYQQQLLSYQQKINAYGSYLDGKYEYNETKVKLDDARKSLKNALKENYTTLLDLENKIDRLKEQTDSTNTKLGFAKSQVDMGLMLKNDYDKKVLASEDLDTSLRKLVNIHNNLKDSIEKPWILSSK